VANFTLLVFLALRNTPLAPLSGNSYEKLRPLHKVAGYTCIVTSVIHGITYTVDFAQKGKLERYKEKKNFSGAIAGVAMLIIGFSTIGYFVQKSYESESNSTTSIPGLSNHSSAFYVIHLVMFILILITVGMHRPDFSRSTVIIVICIACLWGADRLIRLAKKSRNFVGNNATLTPMADGAVRVKLQRNLQCSPGSHAFLWIPYIRWLETHPFTLVSNEPAEFLVREYNGFTRDLLKIAREQPGKILRCSVDGGYGQIPNFMKFDRVVLVAGGSGATFTFNITLNVLRECARANILKPIDFFWVVRHTGMFSPLVKLPPMQNG
jgi:predicted ferric reductase